VAAQVGKGQQAAEFPHHQANSRDGKKRGFSPFLPFGQNTGISGGWNIPSHLVSFERLPDCGHNVVVDNPDRVFGAIQEFILTE
jgi:pimeloyl-ACP methyl ester carboxylesterase